MIYGIGIDLCSAARMEKSLESPAFCARIFGQEEWVGLERLSLRRRGESAAANFAAKEAFLKAAGVGLGAYPMKDIQCIRLESGAPRLVLSGAAARLMEEQRLTAHVSLTHEGGLAQAMVLLEICPNQ